MDSYVECLVKRKTSTVLNVLKVIMVGIMLVSVLLSSLNVLFLLLSLLMLVGIYFVSLYSKTEYEYLYVEKEITVDKIMNQSKRKQAEKFDLNEMEIFAPINSWRINPDAHSDWKVTDYSTGEIKKPDRRYVMIFAGKRKVIFEPSEEFVKVMKDEMPRKVFTD